MPDDGEWCGEWEERQGWGWEERIEKKKSKIAGKMAALRGRGGGDDDQGDGEKWRTRKLEKLEMKLARLEVKKEYVMKKKQERAHCGEVKKGMRKQEGLQRRLSNIRDAKLRVERKQEEIRIRLERLEGGDGVAENGEKRKEHLRGHLAKLEERETFLMSREREVEELLLGRGGCCSVSEGGGGRHDTAAEGWECHSQQQPWRRTAVAHCDVGSSGVGLASGGSGDPLECVFFAKE